jgi:hypothetical protein
MKLNSKYLKELILEVLDEATRRDFLRGAAGAAASAGLGLDALADEPEEIDLSNVGDFKGNKAFSTQDTDELEVFRGLIEPPASYQEGKVALDKLRVTPDMPYYTVAPVQDSVTGVPYAYVDMAALYDEADKSYELSDAVMTAEAFYQDWTAMQIYKYVFGQLAFWGTFKDEKNPQSQKMAKTIKSQDRWNRDVDVSLLPLAWTVSLDIFLTRIVELEGRLSQYPSQRRQILASEGLGEASYAELLGSYEQLLGALNDPATIQNPNYQPPEGQ